MAYGMSTAPCSTAVEKNGRHITQCGVADGTGRRDGNYYIVDESVYEIPVI